MVHHVQNRVSAERLLRLVGGLKGREFHPACSKPRFSRKAFETFCFLLVEDNVFGVQNRVSAERLLRLGGVLPTHHPRCIGRFKTAFQPKGF